MNDRIKELKKLIENTESTLKLHLEIMPIIDNIKEAHKNVLKYDKLGAEICDPMHPLCGEYSFLTELYMELCGEYMEILKDVLEKYFDVEYLEGLNQQTEFLKNEYDFEFFDTCNIFDFYNYK